MGLGKERQSGHTLRFESVGDEVEKSGTSTFRCHRDGGSQEGFVVELALIAAIELKDAVFAHHVSRTRLIGAGG